MVLAKKWILAKKFDDLPSEHDIVLKEETLPELTTGDVLLETVYLSLDPYTKLCGIKMTDSENLLEKLTDHDQSKMLPKEYLTMLLGAKLGATIPGEQLVKVLKSKNTKYPEGTLLLTKLGWRTHTVINPDKMTELVKHLPNIDDLPPSLTLGILGLPGAAAYVSVLKKAELKKGETVLVNTSTDTGTGCVAAQLAFHLGCNVVVMADLDKKVQCMKQLGFPHVFNHKEVPLDETLKKMAPKGFDVFIDCAGGEITTTLIHHHMKKFGRIILTDGLIAHPLTTSNLTTDKHPYLELMVKELTIKGMFSTLYMEDTELTEAVAHIKTLIKEGKLIYKEHIVEGFETTLTTFNAMLEGNTVGKTLVKL